VDVPEYAVLEQDDCVSQGERLFTAEPRSQAVPGAAHAGESRYRRAVCLASRRALARLVQGMPMLPPCVRVSSVCAVEHSPPVIGAGRVLKDRMRHCLRQRGLVDKM